MKDYFLVKVRQTEETLFVEIDGMVFTQTTIIEKAEVKDTKGVYTSIEERIKEEVL